MPYIVDGFLAFRRHPGGSISGMSVMRRRYFTAVGTAPCRGLVDGE